MDEKNKSVNGLSSYNFIKDKLLSFFKVFIVASISSYVIYKLIYDYEIEGVVSYALMEILNNVWNFIFGGLNNYDAAGTLYRSFITILLFLLIEKLTKNWIITFEKNDTDSENINNVNYLKILKKSKDSFFSIFRNFFDKNKLIKFIKICLRFLFYSIAAIYIFHFIYLIIREINNITETTSFSAHIRSIGSVLFYYYIRDFNIRFIRIN